MTRFVLIVAVIATFFLTVHPRNSKSRRFISNRIYLPRCKFDENIIKSNELFAEKIKEAEVIFTGKVTSDVIIVNNNTVLFSVIVRRYFKNTVGLSKNKEVRIAKPLNEGEGVKCRQPLRVKYTAIFVGRKSSMAQDVDVILAVSPVPVTLNNLDRVSAATKGYLATGDSFKTIGHSFRMGFRTVSAIVLEVCTSTWNRMQPLCMPEPTKEIWENSINGFYQKWQFPNCLRTIDGKQITIKCPDKTGSNYFCYLQKFSFALLAIVDYDYKFISIDVGGYGRNSDGGLFEESVMGQRLSNRTFHVPKDRNLPNQQKPTPYVLISDEAFLLNEFLMRPFPHRQSRCDERKEKFNKRLCRARHVVENSFGILSHR